MRGKLNKKENNTWKIVYTPVIGFDREIPLHPDDATYCLDADNGNDIQFEIVTVGSKDDLIGKEYARIIHLDEYEYPLLDGTNRLCDDIIARRIAENSTYGIDPINHPLMIEIRREQRKKERLLAEKAWEIMNNEGDANEREYWIHGFISSLIGQKISKEESDKAVTEHWNNYEYTGLHKLYESVFKDAWRLAIEWHQENLKNKS